MINKELFDKSYELLQEFSERTKGAENFGFRYSFDTSYYHFGDYPTLAVLIQNEKLDYERFVHQIAETNEEFELFKAQVNYVLNEINEVINEIKSKEPYVLQKTKEAAQ